MSDSSGRVKASSVAAFIFLPQFGRMIRGTTFIGPAFMRTIAGLFVQSGLLPPTHPALAYGTPGVEKYRFSALMSDAWHALRSTDATSYQWSTFCSVVFMLFAMATSIFIVLFNLAIPFLGTAAAQVYTGPLGDTGGDTASLTTPCTKDNTIFCRVIPDNGTAHGDYAIDFLDKILRLGANNTGNDIQNALRGLMNIYNSGILVIAGIMLFWLIISVVVDTARTGQIGGQRHNMVWAPIRIVFALGLMIPLGSTGFSSGQFMVMKLAEYGSNFGTRAWMAYLDGLSDDHVSVTVPPPKQEVILPLVRNYARMMTCRVAWNGYGLQSEGEYVPGPPATGFDPAQKVVAVPDLVRQQGGDVMDVAGNVVHYQNLGHGSYAYTNKTHQALCGRVIYPTDSDPSFQEALNPAITDQTSAKANNARAEQIIVKAWDKLFVGDPYSTSNAPDGPGTDKDAPAAGAALGNVHNIAANWACGFVAQHIWGTTDSGRDVLDIDCGSQGIDSSAHGTCGSGPANSGQYPDMGTCVDTNGGIGQSTMIGLIDSTMDEAEGHAYAYLGGNAGLALGSRGWAGMGVFYKDISSMNVTVRNMMKIPVVIEAPAPFFGQDGQTQKLKEVATKFEDWWNKLPKMEPINSTVSKPDDGGGGLIDSFTTAASGAASTVSGVASDMASTAASLELIQLSPVGFFMSQITDKIKADLTGTHLILIPDAKDVSQKYYPLGILSNIGSSLIEAAITLYTAVTAVEIGAGAIPTVAEGATLAASPIAHLLTVVGMSMLTLGGVLLFYLPCLPMIRVTFAVLVWGSSVFEAVMLLPIAALSFLSTVGEGWDAKHVFINWMEILTRPVLTVIGFVGSLLVFDTFFAYFQSIFPDITQDDLHKGLLIELIGVVVHCAMFVTIMQAALNMCLKMINEVPNAVFRWGPLGGSPSQYRDPAENFGNSVSGVMGKMGQSIGRVSGTDGRGTSSARTQTGQVRKGTGKAAGAVSSAFKKGIGKITPSDRLLKENISFIGLENGHNVYSFNYIGQPQTYIGVMADEIRKTHPGAVGMLNGFLGVDYDQIGVQFRKAD